MNKNHIIIVGQKFSYDSYKALSYKEQDALYNKLTSGALELDRYKPMPKDKLTCIFDGMNGQYIILGIVLAMTLIGDEEDFPFVEINPQTLAEVTLMTDILINESGVRKELKDETKNIKMYVLTSIS